MKIYTEVNYEWIGDELVQVSSSSFDHNGEVAECKAGGQQQSTLPAAQGYSTPSTVGATPQQTKMNQITSGGSPGGKAGGGEAIPSDSFTPAPSYQAQPYQYPTSYRQNMPFDNITPQPSYGQGVPGWAQGPYRQAQQLANNSAYNNFAGSRGGMWGAPPPTIDLENMQAPQVRESLIGRGTLGLPEVLTAEQRQALSPLQRQQRQAQKQQAYEAMTPAQRQALDQDRAFRKGNMGAQEFADYRTALQNATPGYANYQGWRERAEAQNAARDKWESGMQDYQNTFTPEEQGGYNNWQQGSPGSGKGGGYAQPYQWG